MDTNREREIQFYLRNEKYTIDPTQCRKHMWEHMGWDFRDEKCSSIKMVARCAYCGKMAYGIKELKAVGPNSFDIDDVKLIKSGILGPHIIERRYREEVKRL